MEENLRWYKEKKLDRLCEVLLDKGYLIHRVFSVKDAQEKILSLLNREQTVALGDSWELMNDEFISKIKLGNNKEDTTKSNKSNNNILYM